MLQFRGFAQSARCSCRLAPRGSAHSSSASVSRSAIGGRGVRGAGSTRRRSPFQMNSNRTGASRHGVGAPLRGERTVEHHGAHQLRARRHAELAFHARQIGSDRLNRDRQGCGHHLERRAGGHLRGDHALASAEPGGTSAGVRCGCEPGHETPGVSAEDAVNHRPGPASLAAMSDRRHRCQRVAEAIREGGAHRFERR